MLQRSRVMGWCAVIQSVDRALRILAVLQGDHRMSLGRDRAAARPAALDRARHHPHPAGRTGWSCRSSTPGLYRLGPAVLTLGNVYLDTLELRSRVVPWAEDLARRTGYAVRTGVMLLDDVVVVHHEPRPDGSRQMPEVGIVIPAHACALGKAMLAFDDEVADSVLDPSHRLRSMTGDTITDPRALAARSSRRSVRTGIATEVEEARARRVRAGGTASATGSGRPPARSASSYRASEWPLESAVVDALRTAARSVSRELGATRWPPAGHIRVDPRRRRKPKPA